MTEKRYIGAGKSKSFDNGGTIIKYSATIEDLEKEIAIEKAAGKTWININICERREPSEKGMTHYGIIDTWEPKPQGDSPQEQPAPQTQQVTQDQFDDDIPF